MPWKLLVNIFYKNNFINKLNRIKDSQKRRKSNEKIAKNTAKYCTFSLFCGIIILWG